MISLVMIAEEGGMALSTACRGFLEGELEDFAPRLLAGDGAESGQVESRA